MDLILLVIFGYALYRMAVNYNITPWKWIIRFVSVFFLSVMGLLLVVTGIYGEASMKDMDVLGKHIAPLQPFVLLYQFILFFIFRSWMIRYVHHLDMLEKDNNNDGSNNNHTPDSPHKDQKDFSYFR